MKLYTIYIGTSRVINILTNIQGVLNIKEVFEDLGFKVLYAEV